MVTVIGIYTKLGIGKAHGGGRLCAMLPCANPLNHKVILAILGSLNVRFEHAFAGSTASTLLSVIIGQNSIFSKHKVHIRQREAMVVHFVSGEWGKLPAIQAFSRFLQTKPSVFSAYFTCQSSLSPHHETVDIGINPTPVHGRWSDEVEQKNKDRKAISNEINEAVNQKRNTPRAILIFAVVSTFSAMTARNGGALWQQ